MPGDEREVPTNPPTTDNVACQLRIDSFLSSYPSSLRPSIVLLPFSPPQRFSFLPRHSHLNPLNEKKSQKKTHRPDLLFRSASTTQLPLPPHGQPSRSKISPDFCQ